MRFKIDENLHHEVAEYLRQEGHDAETVHAEGLRGADDAVRADHCRREDRAIVTLDLDFADIRMFPPAANSGIIVLRISNQSRGHVLNVMMRVLHLLKTEPVVGRLWIVSDAGARIRGR